MGSAALVLHRVSPVGSEVTHRGSWTFPVLKRWFTNQSPKCVSEEGKSAERVFATVGKVFINRSRFHKHVLLLLQLPLKGVYCFCSTRKKKINTKKKSRFSLTSLKK